MLHTFNVFFHSYCHLALFILNVNHENNAKQLLSKGKHNFANLIRKHELDEFIDDSRRDGT